MTYQEALSFIHSVEWQGSRPGLERITELLDRLGHPEQGLKAVHVAGTNGKGSFCAMLASVLRQAGYRTGLFVSPYIERFEERIRCNDSLISEEELAELVTELAPHCRAMSDLPTEFEILTALGFLYFKKQKVDIAVIECGMGGRLDSTNVLTDPLLSVITGIALDHTAFLGNTVEAIATEKAGIIKEGRPVLYGGKDPIAMAVIEAVAKEKKAPITTKDLDALQNIVPSLKGTSFDYRNLTSLHIPLLGSYQPENAASVIEAITVLRTEGINISDAALRKGLAEVVWQGRFEKMNDAPAVFFDGGHNEEGVKAAVTTAKELYGEEKLLVISGVMKDKDYRTIAEEITSIASHVYTVTPDNPRALPAKAYAEVYEAHGAEATPCDSFDAAVTSAYRRAEKEERPLLCVGSLYAYGDFKKALTKEIAEAAKRKSKKRAKRLLCLIASLFVVLLGLNLLLDSDLLSDLFGPRLVEVERDPVFLYPADYDENIFEDEEYMAKNRLLYYAEGAQALYIANRRDAATAGDIAVLFYDYFDAVIRGDHVAHNRFFTEEYLEEYGPKDCFTMQRLYHIEIELINTFVRNEGEHDESTVYEFDVRYAIDRNNGTFRDDLESDTTRPFVYQIVQDPYSGEWKINIISEYKIAA